MKKLVNPTSPIALSLLLFLSTICVNGQQPGEPHKKVPAMSSDDIDVAASTKQPTAGSPGAATPGLTRYWPASCGLSIELPIEPHRFDMPQSRLEGQTMGALEIYTSRCDDYTVTVRHYKRSGPGRLSPEDCVKIFFQAVSSGGIYRNMNYTLLDNSANRASFRGGWGDAGPSGSEGPRFVGFAQVEGRHTWLVLAVYAVVKPSTVQEVRDIVASARLDGPPCTE